MAQRVRVMLFLGLVFLQCCIQTATAERYPPPAVFVFGDSLVDNGNNNYIDTLAKANILFHGIDFPGGATGRFCNGRTIVDIICDMFEVPYPPPFLDPSANGSRILRGVNYASAAAGILDESGANFLGRISMNQQISYFQDETIPAIQAQLGTDATNALLGSSLVNLIVGSNDFLNNYFLKNSNTKNQYNPAQFNILLYNAFSRQLATLYSLGFRKFFVAGLGPLGCIPEQLAAAGLPQCVSAVNAQILDYNAGVKAMLKDLNDRMSGAIFLYGESYNSLMMLINDPAAHAFTNVNQGCCGGGLYRGQIVCQPLAQLCDDRSEYVFWDPYHLTEASNIFLANGMYNGDIDRISPINALQLFSS